MIAGEERAADLRRVGVVTQGARRSFLFVGPSNRGYIARRGDCLGREHMPIDRDGKSPGDYPQRGVLLAE